MKTVFLFAVIVLNSLTQSVVQAKAPMAKALLWEISGNGLAQPSYLFGTSHLACVNQLILTPNQKKAIAAANYLYVEIKPDDQKRRHLKDDVNNKKKQKLEDVATSSQYQIIEDYFSKSYLDFLSENSSAESVVSKLTSQASRQVANSFFKKLCKETTSKESILLEFAKENNIPIDGIETIADRVSIFNSIPLKNAISDLVDIINSAETIEKYDNSLASAYFKQDINRLVEESRSSENTVDKAYRRDRNFLWIKKMSKIIKQRRAFFAFGAAHLGGENGLINLLEKQGYVLRPVFDIPVQYPLSARLPAESVTAKNYFDAGKKASNAGENLESIDNYSQAIAANPRYVEAYHQRGLVRHLYLNDFTGALSDFNQANYINPKYIGIYYDRAILKADGFNDFSGALRDFNQSINLQTGESAARSFLKRGLLQDRRLNNFSAALNDYSTYLSLMPQSVDGYIIRGILKHNKLKDKLGGIADFRRAAKIARTTEQIGTLNEVRLVLDALNIREKVIP